MKFSTVSGSMYEIKHNRVRRVNRNAEKRGDGDWHLLWNKPTITRGEPVTLILSSLAAFGPDDYDTPPEDVSNYTTRVTSPVIWIGETN